MTFFRVRRRALQRASFPCYSYKRRAAVGGPITVTLGHFPEYTRLSESIQDQNHGSCYPHCGGPMKRVRVELSHGIVPSARTGYEYKDPYLIALYQGCASKPAGHIFDSLPQAKDVGKSPVSYGEEEDLTMPSTLTDVSQSLFEKARPKLAKLSLMESLVDFTQTSRLLKKGAERIQQAYESLTPKKKELFDRPSYRLTERQRKDKFVVETEFGWKPFVSDVVGFFDLIKNSETYINRLVRYNGYWHRRRSGTYQIDSGTSVRTFGAGYGSYYIIPAAYSLKQGMQCTEYSDTVRFVGNFRYYVPGLRRDTFVGRAAALSVLTGLHLNPRNVYQAIPWSWFADWFTNVGTWVDHFTSTTQEECCMKYGYLTRKRELQTSATYFCEGSYRPISSSTAASKETFAVSSSSKTSELMRYAAPSQFFGFTSPSALTARQAHILTSLMG